MQIYLYYFINRVQKDTEVCIKSFFSSLQLLSNIRLRGFKTEELKEIQIENRKMGKNTLEYLFISRNFD